MIEDLQAAAPKYHFAAGQESQYLDELSRIRRSVRAALQSAHLTTVDAQKADLARLHVGRADVRYTIGDHGTANPWLGTRVGTGPTLARMSLKDTCELYEYWAYLYLFDCLLELGFGVEDQEVLNTSGAGASSSS